MISDSRPNNSAKDQSESPNMYSRYLERSRSVRDRKEKGWFQAKLYQISSLHIDC